MSDGKDNVISLSSRRKTKDSAKSSTNKRAEDLGTRLTNIKESIDRINALMGELKGISPGAPQIKENASLESNPKISETFRKKEEALKKIKKDNNERVKRDYRL